MNVVNLYAFKSTNPAIMCAQADPTGDPENVAAIRRYVANPTSASQAGVGG